MLRLKVGEDVQIREKCVSDVQIVLIATAPAERLAVCDSFEVARADAATVKDFLLGEIAADHADYADVGKEARRDRKVRGRAAQHLVTFTERGFDAVISN